MRKLDYWTEEIAAQIRQYDPHAHIDITRNTYEGEDAYVIVETIKNVGEVMDIARKAQNDAMDDGYFIPVLPTKMKTAVGM